MIWTLFEEGALHDTAFAQPLYLVKPILPFGGLAMLHGPKTAGKTQLALTLGIAIRYGEPFLHEYGCQQGAVVMIETDMTRQTLQERARSAPRTRGLHFVVADPFNIVRVSNLPAFEPLITLQRLCPALVIVDSLRKTTVGLDEKDSGSPALVYSAWKKLFPESTILIIHHDRKKPRDADAYLHQEEAARGTGAWLDDCDTGFHLTRLRESGTGDHVATLSFSKCRTMEEPVPIALKMDPDTLLLEPSKPTARQRLHWWLADNPSGSREDAMVYLLEKRLCGKSLAYRLTQEEMQNAPR